MAFLKSSELFTSKMEASAGAFDSTVKADNVDVRVRELTWTNEVAVDNETSGYMTGTFFQSDESIVGVKTVTAGYKIKVAPAQFTPETTVGAGDAKHVLTYSDFLENCSMKKVGVGTDVTDATAGLWAFYPDQANAEKTMSIARIVYDSAEATYQVFQGSGAMSNFTLSCDGVASPFNIAFETKGSAQDVIEATTGVATLDETKIMRTVADSLRNTTVKITDLATDVATEFCISTLELQSGNELTPVECQNSDSGISHFMVTKVDPIININPLLKTLTDFDWWEALSNEKMYKVEIDSEFLSIFIPRAQLRNANVTGDQFLRNEISLRPLVNLDNSYPTWIPVGDLPTDKFAIPYFIGIKESLKNY